jgi:hypothetical protein
MGVLPPLKQAFTSQFCNSALKRGGVFAYSQTVDALRHTAKFRDCYPMQRRQNRNDTSGYAKSVYFTERGLMSGSWGIQHGISRNNHVVYLCSDSRTRKLILQPAKTYKGINVMNATLSPVGASACSAEHLRFTPAYQASLSYTPVPKPIRVKPASLHYDETQTGIIAYFRGLPVAWLVCGYHTGQIDKKLKTCRFIDVVYHRKTNNGVNLETFDCDTVEEAKASLSRIFGGAV